MKRIFFLILLALLWIGPAQAQSPGPGPGPGPGRSQTAPETGFFTGIGKELLKIQTKFNRQLTGELRAYRDEGSWAGLMLGLGIAFLYGVLHTLGPGHGKLVVTSYFLSEDAKFSRGLWMGGKIAFFHVISAIVVVWFADFLLRRILGGTPAEIPAIRWLSYGAIALVGAVMSIEAWRHRHDPDHGVCCDHDHGHGHEHGHHHHRDEEGRHGKRQTFLSLGVGMIPCSGAVLVLLFALANDIVAAGLAMAAAIGLGMAVAMAALGFLSIFARRLVLRWTEKSGSGARSGLRLVLALGGPLLITLIGLGLLLGSLAEA